MYDELSYNILDSKFIGMGQIEICVWDLCGVLYDKGNLNDTPL